MATSPSVIGRYQIRSRLGEGGMGVVYLAYDPAMDSDIAIKVLRSSAADEDLRKRFAREAQMARRVGIHPNVVTIFDIGEHDGDPYIAMEYVSGQTLEHVIRRQALPRATRRLHIVEDVCTGLTHAHRAGLVHRDIKPANVMLKDDGTVKILDFGIARVAESTLTADGMVIGALNYMSPEQMTGSSLDARSDVFAVGALFYELLSGRRAFPGSIREGLPYRIIHGMPPPLGEVVADLDPEIERIILRALEKDPAKRYQDVGTMRQEIARVRRRLEHAQIEKAITQAREAFDTGDYEAVVASCVEITSLDPDEPRALELLQKTESARTGEHADTAAAALPDSERPTIALPVPGPASTSGITAAPSPAPSHSGTRAAIPAPVSVTAPAFVPAPVVPTARKPSVLLPVAVAMLAIVALLGVAVFAWRLGRSVSSRDQDSPATATAARAAVPPVAQPSPLQSTPAQSATEQPPASASKPSQATATATDAEPAPAVGPAPTPTPAEPLEARVEPPAPQQASTTAPKQTQAAPASSPDSRSRAATAPPLPASTPTSPVRGTSAPTRPVSTPSPSASTSASAAAPVAPAPTPAASSVAAAQAAAQSAGQPVETDDDPEPTRAPAVRTPQDGRAGERLDDPPYGRDGRSYGNGTRSRDGARYPRGAGSRYGGESTGRYGGRGELLTPDGEIRRTMRMFQASWDRLDLEGMRRVFPTFIGGPNQPYRNYTIEFDNVRVVVNGSQGSVHTLVRETLRSGMGGRARPTAVIFQVEERRDGRWIINSMQRAP